MQFGKSFFLGVATIGLLTLNACAGSNNQSSGAASSPEATTVTSSPATESPATESPSAAGTGQKQQGALQGGQVVESGPYHLEMITAKESDGVHIDFFLQKGDNHEAVPGAKVTAQVQLPDGSQQSLNFEYDDEGQHYTALLPSTALGEYKIVILSDVSGEKVNGRFSFSQ